MHAADDKCERVGFDLHAADAKARVGVTFFLSAGWLLAVVHRFCLLPHPDRRELVTLQKWSLLFPLQPERNMAKRFQKRRRMRDS